MKESKKYQIEDVTFTLHDVTKMQEFYYRSDYSFTHVDPSLFFTLANRIYPSTRSISDLTTDVELVNRFKNKFKIGNENCFYSQQFFSKENNYHESHILVMVKRNLIVDFYTDRPSPYATVLFSHETEHSLLRDVCGMLEETVQKLEQPHIGLLTFDSLLGTNLTNIALDVPEMDLAGYYNEDLQPVHNIILSRLNEPKGKGVVLLHGIPGTGKTTYLRYLSSLVKKQLIFIPYEVAQRISSPDFLSFMLRYKESVLILEDAENLLRSREDGQNLSVASLLNLSDGLLSDCLHMQLICTFNTDIMRLDKALLRKGRIIARYEFKPLSKEKSALLSAQIDHNSIIDHPMTLAEIFNFGAKDYSIQKSRKIGFA